MDGPHVLRLCSHVIDVFDGRRLVKKADLQKQNRQRCYTQMKYKPPKNGAPARLTSILNSLLV